MKNLFAAAVCALAVSSASHAALYAGDITTSGNYSGAVTRNDAWVQENPVSGDEVSFWRFSGIAGQRFSVTVTSTLNGVDTLDAAISLYSGSLASEFELIVPGFDNDGNFADLTFLGSTPIFGSAGNDAFLLDFLLPASGIYTLAVGGESFLNFADSYGYRMQVVNEVPVPAAVWLFGSGLMGLAGASASKRKAA
jgi:opacity protein-like surface antigen